MRKPFPSRATGPVYLLQPSLPLTCPSPTRRVMAGPPLTGCPRREERTQADPCSPAGGAAAVLARANNSGVSSIEGTRDAEAERLGPSDSGSRRPPSGPPQGRNV